MATKVYPGNGADHEPPYYPASHEFNPSICSRWLISFSLDGGTGGIGRSWEPAQMTPPKIVALREGDLPAAAAALSPAFQDDPLQTYVLPDPVERAAQSPGIFASLLRYGLNFGELLTADG